MIETLRITNPFGTTLILNLASSDREEGLVVFNIAGFGPPKATVTGQGGPNFDGTRISGITVDPRHIVLTLAVGGSGATEEEAKQKIYDFFPIKQEVTLRITTATKDVYTTAIVETNEMNQFAKVENAVIGLYCNYPYFMDMVSGGARFLSDTPTTLTNDGEIPVGVQMAILLGYSGTFEPIVITNTNGNQTMTIDPSMILIAPPPAPGDLMTIDTRKTQKSVLYARAESTWVGSMLNTVPIDSDWIQLYSGNNIIEVSGGGGIHTNAPGLAALDEYYRLDEIVDDGSIVDLVAGQVMANYVDIGFAEGPPKLYSSARRFDGTPESYFRNETGNSWSGFGSFAISMWVYPEATGDIILVSSDESGLGGYILKATIASPNSTLSFGIRPDASTWKWAVQVDNELQVGYWTHVYAAYDSVLEESYVLMGNQLTAPTPPYGGIQTGVTGSIFASRCSVGGVQGGSDWMDARISALAFYNRLLTYDEWVWVLGTPYEINLAADAGRTFVELIGESDTKVIFRPEYEGV